MTCKTPKAQVTLEYTSLAVLVILAVLVMGSYVVRAINAYFKTSDDAIEDSVLEEILPAHDIDAPACACGPVIAAPACGGNCNPWEREYDPNCSPPGCSGENYCINERGICCPPVLDGCNAFGCLNGSRARNIMTCPGEVPAYDCVADATCQVECVPDTLPPFSAWCLLGGVTPAGPAPVTMLVTTSTTFVNPGECDDTFCQAECQLPAIATPAHDGCYCPAIRHFGANFFQPWGWPRKIYEPAAALTDGITAAGTAHWVGVGSNAPEDLGILIGFRVGITFPAPVNVTYVEYIREAVRWPDGTYDTYLLIGGAWVLINQHPKAGPYEVRHINGPWAGVRAIRIEAPSFWSVFPDWGDRNYTGIIEITVIYDPC